MSNPACPDPLPAEVRAHVIAFAKAWANSPERPQVRPEVRNGLKALLDDWIADVTLPLLVRKSAAGRGVVIAHSSGRKIVPADNSPAQWSLGLALQGVVPTLGQIRQWLDQDQIPVAMILTRNAKELATYRCTGRGTSLNDLNWKLGHIDPVGLGRVDLATAELKELKEHMRLFLDPANMFLVPLKWAGLAEVEDVIEAIRSTDQA